MTTERTKTFAPAVANSASTRHASALPKNASIIIIGAGAFGGWSALHLLRAGMRVTLIDAWGPGNSRSSSGDESRVIRSTYGPNEFYFNLNVRSVELWKEFQAAISKPLFTPTGALWFCYNEHTPIVDDSIPFAQKRGLDYRYITHAELTLKYPLINSDDLHHAYFDPYAGFVKARDACQEVVNLFCQEGGNYIQADAKPGRISNNSIEEIHLSNGSSLKADVYLFACGSWLGQLFPDVLSNLIECSKQEVYYFGVPRNLSKQFDNMPVWIDADDNDHYYGIPGNSHRGFKLGVDKRGAPFDPSDDDRLSDPDVLKAARNFIGHRFRGLKNAPLIESRVCPYENSPDGNFVFDHHPEASNLWFLGGGSGHGFKHGPGLGEIVANVFSQGHAIPALFHSVGR